MLENSQIFIPSDGSVERVSAEMRCMSHSKSFQYLFK